MLLKFAQCSFSFKSNKIQKDVSYITYGGDSLALWALSLQIENIATIGILFSLILFKFIAEGDSGFLRCISVKVF